MTPRVIGSDALPASFRFWTVVLREPEISVCSALSLVSYSSWISGVRPTPGTVWVFVQLAQVRCSCSPSTRVAQLAAAWGEDQVLQERLAQFEEAMDEVSATLRPLTRL